MTQSPVRPPSSAGIAAKTRLRAGAITRPTVRFAPGTTVDAQGFLPTIPNE